MRLEHVSTPVWWLVGHEYISLLSFSSQVHPALERVVDLVKALGMIFGESVAYEDIQEAPQRTTD